MTTSVVVSRPGLGLGLGLKTIFADIGSWEPWSWSRIAKVSVLSRSRKCGRDLPRPLRKQPFFNVFVGDS